MFLSRTKLGCFRDFISCYFFFTFLVILMNFLGAKLSWLNVLHFTSISIMIVIVDVSTVVRSDFLPVTFLEFLAEQFIPRRIVFSFIFPCLRDISYQLILTFLFLSPRDTRPRCIKHCLKHNNFPGSCEFNPCIRRCWKSDTLVPCSKLPMVTVYEDRHMK